MRPRYCYDLDSLEPGEPCPFCGATEEGKDRARGVCQAIRPYSKPQPYLEIVVKEKWPNLMKGGDR